MSIRGRKPKPVALKLVEGNRGHRPLPEVAPPDPATIIPDDFDNGLVPPKRLAKRQDQLWRSIIRRAEWLTDFDVPKAFMWVELQAAFEKKPAEMVAAKLGQLRALGSELMLDPASRQRQGWKSPADGKKRNAAENYFDD